MMVENPRSERGGTPKGPARISVSRASPALVGVLGFLVVVLAGFGLYALTSAYDNSGERIAGSATAQGASQCVMDDKFAERLDRRATGEVAAFSVSERPVNLSDLAFNDADGKRVTLKDWSGKTVLLNLWATWCKPCRVEMPALQALDKDLAGMPFDVVAVSVDLGTDEKPKAFYEENGLASLGFYHDAELTSLDRLKADGLAFGLPASLLIDKSGCVLGALNGPAEWHSPEAKALVGRAISREDEGG